MLVVEVVGSAMVTWVYNGGEVLVDSVTCSIIRYEGFQVVVTVLTARLRGFLHWIGWGFLGKAINLGKFGTLLLLIWTLKIHSKPVNFHFSQIEGLP